MRAFLTRTSWMVLFNMCPMCSTPVTLGGGITTQNGFLFLFGVEWKKPLSSQWAYHLSSTSAGLYLADRDMKQVKKRPKIHKYCVLPWIEKDYAAFLVRISLFAGNHTQVSVQRMAKGERRRASDSIEW